MNLVDDLRYGYIDDDAHGPAVDDTIRFLRRFVELCRKRKTLTLFGFRCLCLGQFPRHHLM